MKRSMARWGLALLVGAFFVSCAPEEEGVCKHEMKVYDGDPSAPSYLKSIDACVEAYEKKQKRRGMNSYRREVECILSVDTQYAIRRCQETEAKRAD